MRGQSLLEMALCMPLLLLLVLGSVAVIRLADARAGLDAATSAAAAAAARASDPASADTAARARFQAVIAAYPVSSPTLSLDLAGFARGVRLQAVGAAQVDLTMAPAPGLPRRLAITSVARAEVQPWRSRR